MAKMLRIATLFCLYFTIVLSKSYRPVDIPNPIQFPEKCGRVSSEITKSTICDPDNILSDDSKNILEGYIQNIKNAQIGVLIIEKMSPTFIKFSSIETSSESFARTVHDSWGVGDASINNGVLIFLSIQDRAIYISTGAGVSSKLTSHAINTIIEFMKEPLRDRNFGKAMEYCILNIKDILSGNNALPYSSSSSESSDFSVYVASIPVLAFCLTVFMYLYDCLKMRRLKKGRDALDKLMKELHECKEDESFLSKTCPICLDDLQLPEESKSDNDLENNTTDPSLKSRKSNTSSKRPMVLRCGHVFCHECLSLSSSLEMDPSVPFVALQSTPKIQGPPVGASRRVRARAASNIADPSLSIE